MSIQAEIRALDPTPKDLRSFGLLVGLVFALIGVFLISRAYLAGPPLAALGATLLLAGTFAPRRLRPAYFGWMALAITLGVIMTHVLLTLFFVIVLLPVGLFFRLIRRDVLERRPDRQAASYWKDKTYPIADRTRFEKMF
ncbi:MAG: SxtJ family membrane protein [Acidobacteriota bacterium]